MNNRQKLLGTCVYDIMTTIMKNCELCPIKLISPNSISENRCDEQLKKHLLPEEFTSSDIDKIICEQCVQEWLNEESD